MAPNLSSAFLIRRFSGYYPEYWEYAKALYRPAETVVHQLLGPPLKDATTRAASVASTARSTSGVFSNMAFATNTPACYFGRYTAFKSVSNDGNIALKINTPLDERSKESQEALVCSRSTREHQSWGCIEDRERTIRVDPLCVRTFEFSRNNVITDHL
ncbi:hypothetical protein BKA66DRAFT_568395 [Pyrenochaeta sp. MPI-SDFR-AT-0127]|nr:hypothetical protein BKA66DRAFT_568395 [Pyrenochaeta sp. MPI-SDFR-AT-0127]